MQREGIDRSPCKQNQNFRLMSLQTSHITDGWGKQFAFLKLVSTIMQSNIKLLLHLVYMTLRDTYAKYIPIRTRLKYFNTTISQIACYTIFSTTFTRYHYHSLDVAFRSLLRKVIGHPPNWDDSRLFLKLLHQCHLPISHFCTRNNIRT